ncbi:uncharacterized protein LOC112348049 [Selaginella moellendorffii]|uniref:uncharacterized protein LOC112348049 n=1 Tax=Selaginella moellendorffii TaxID=88036 RepID=UPI000D1C7A3E|nr:uncharacterized protein LOC112348049 [Selaginella moellendorffii]|eukprot:XP_024535763.1 uncharacterized protein LOC112348049 [Selaginella moellendorffii]
MASSRCAPLPLLSGCSSLSRSKLPLDLLAAPATIHFHTLHGPRSIGGRGREPILPFCARPRVEAMGKVPDPPRVEAMPEADKVPDPPHRKLPDPRLLKEVLGILETWNQGCCRRILCRHGTLCLEDEQRHGYEHLSPDERD